MSPENMWVKFFTDAGLPSGISATYALTFTDNRIQMNMLLDLNKEYLREMGITCMGDVIAILRHAKQVHDETARDRVLGITEPKVPVATVAARQGLPKAPTPATRMLEHYTRNTNVTTTSPMPSNTVTTVKERLGAMQISGIKRKIITGPTNDSKDEDEVIGTKFTKKIITQKHVAAPVSEVHVEKKVSSVFSRLGSSDENKTLTVSKPSTKLNLTVIKKPIVSSGVFSRLGDKGDEDSDRRDSTDTNEPLKYAGILVKEKVLAKAKPTIPVKAFKKLGTMRADEEPTSIKDKLPVALRSKKSVKFSPHVDYKEIEKRPPPSPIVRNLTPIRTVRTVALTTKLPNKIVKKTPITIDNHGIKSRLGKQNTLKINNKSSVFNRLGLTT